MISRPHLLRILPLVMISNFSVESAPCSTPAFSDLENDDGESVDSREDNRNEFVESDHGHVLFVSPYN